MAKRRKNRTIKSDEFRWWIMNLPSIITKEDLKEKYLDNNINAINNSKEININKLIELAKSYGKTII